MPGREPGHHVFSNRLDGLCSALARAGRQVAAGGHVVHRLRQHCRKALQQFGARQAGLLGQRVEQVRAQGLAHLILVHRLVLAGRNPAVCLLAKAGLAEMIDQVAEAAGGRTARQGLAGTGRGGGAAGSQTLVTWENSSSTGVGRPKMDTATLSRDRSSSTSST